MIFDPFSSLIPISMIMVGCCTNVVTLELIIKSSQSQGNLITFFQFLVVAIISFFNNIKWKHVGGPFYKPVGFEQRKIPMKIYLLMILVFFSVSVLNNLALDYDIALPFHMIFRSSSMISTVVIGTLFWKKKYTFKQIISLSMVTVGIIIATISSAPDHKKDFGMGKEKDTFVFVLGLLMLTFAMFMSSVLGLIQEHTYNIYGKDRHKETIFYTHVLPLPFFLIFKEDLYNHMMINNQSSLLDLPFGLGSYPSLWVYLFLNVITQYICIQGVFILTGKTSTLTCTLVISIRKFLSIIISVIYFNNPFPPTLWISTVLVFVGTFLYSDPFKKKKVE
ncbi:hypothetical protein CYY_000446 [Polysphondylium violaceum]|uniref:Uncharacterized protein n=1 Tax=Polysphondylium violaceum TaxID=133409 RepID=A0A8J4UX67_9MYCE|nr:hypothetical protein CYY_000446 [Polysphondylium violaceum]